VVSKQTPDEYLHSNPLPDRLQYEVPGKDDDKEGQTRTFPVYLRNFKEEKMSSLSYQWCGGSSAYRHSLTSVCLANLVKDIKLSTTKLIKEKGLFPNFGGWQDGYGAFTYHSDAAHRLIEYVKNQEEHHRASTFEDEYKAILTEHNIAFDENYIF